MFQSNVDGEVVINKYGRHPIGALGDDQGDFVGITYRSDLVKVDEKSITFVHRPKTGLGIVKQWSLEDSDNPSFEYRLKLQVTFKNFGETAVGLKKYSVTTGINAPLFQEEQAHLCR